MKHIIYVIAAMLFVACTNPQQKLHNQIAEGEKALFKDSSMIPDKAKANEMIKLYISFADQYQDDTSSAEYLFRAADLANGLRQPAQAIQLFGRLQRYQHYQKVPIALFLQGFIAETALNDLEKAKGYYTDFLKKYPQHELADDVQGSLNNLGKSPEELIKEFEAKMQQDTALVQ